MSTLLIACIALLIGVWLISWWHRSYARRHHLSLLHQFNEVITRKLSAKERQAAENYCQQFNNTPLILTPESTTPSTGVILNDKSETVFIVTHAITRYGSTPGDPHKLRYFLGATEIHLPAFWEHYIEDNNHIELLPGDGLPLVIALNDHTLSDSLQQNQTQSTSPAPQASIRSQHNEQITLLNIRQETPEEYAFRHPHGLYQAVSIVAAFVLFYLSLISSAVFIPWLAGGGLLLLLLGTGAIYAPPRRSVRREIHCLHGTAKRWGLFSDNQPEHVNNISLGIFDLTYPRHWQPWLTYEVDKPGDIDIYLNHHVVRQGKFLSLHDEIKKFPLQYWLRSAIIATGALLVMIILWASTPLNMPVKFTLSWLKEARPVAASTVAQLAKAPIRIGDTLRLQGIGMCNIHSADDWQEQEKESSPFMPFDCSQIFWSDVPAPPLPSSPVVSKATALIQSVQHQLHRKPDEHAHVSPALRSAIQKSGMVLLDDFDDIVIKTYQLCPQKNDCVRLKNALVNLGNTANWETLTKRASSGKLNGVNILLRPVSAESLENLVATSTEPLISQETLRATQELVNYIAGGFLITSDEGNDLVNQPSAMSLYDYSANDQWEKLQQLTGILTHIPFHAEGVVTHIYNDIKGTQHIMLHPLTDRAERWHYVATTLLLFILLGCIIYHGTFAIIRYRRHRQRMTAIAQYYATCLCPDAPSTEDNPK